VIFLFLEELISNPAYKPITEMIKGFLSSLLGREFLSCSSNSNKKDDYLNSIIAIYLLLALNMPL
jgi:hypothetical protein